MTSATSSPTSITAAERPSEGVKAAKRDKEELSMQFRTVKAQEKLSKSLSYKVDVLKEQILINQAQQRLQEEQALHAMINELFSTKQASRAHAVYLEKRRAGLLWRLEALGETSSPPPLKRAGTMTPPSQQDVTPPANVDSTLPSPTLPSPSTSVLPTPSSHGNSCPSSPAIRGSATTLCINLPSSFSPTTSSLTAGSFPPLTQPSQANDSATEFHGSGL